jgi:hypothetical protein
MNDFDFLTVQETKKFVKISSFNRPKLFASKVKFYSISIILTGLAIKKYSLHSLVVWSQDASFRQILAKK